MAKKYSQFYYNSDGDEVVSLQDIRDYYEASKNDPDVFSEDTFEEYLEGCMDYNNGSLWNMFDYYMMNIGIEMFETTEDAFSWFMSEYAKYGCITDEQFKRVCFTIRDVYINGNAAI